MARSMLHLPNMLVILTAPDRAGSDDRLELSLITLNDDGVFFQLAYLEQRRFADGDGQEDGFDVCNSEFFRDCNLAVFAFNKRLTSGNAHEATGLGYPIGRATQHGPTQPTTTVPITLMDDLARCAGADAKTVYRLHQEVSEFQGLAYEQLHMKHYAGYDK